jgi:hypothetical protein
MLQSENIPVEGARLLQIIDREADLPDRVQFSIRELALHARTIPNRAPRNFFNPAFLRAIREVTVPSIAGTTS